MPDNDCSAKADEEENDSVHCMSMTLCASNAGIKLCATDFAVVPMIAAVASMSQQCVAHTGGKGKGKGKGIWCWRMLLTHALLGTSAAAVSRSYMEKLRRAVALRVGMKRSL